MKKHDREIAFLSEHTAEFVIVPQIVSLLSLRYRRVVALRFSLSREGSRISYEQDEEKSVAIISVFARRPKVATNAAETLSVKFNAELLEYANEASQFGIATFAGVPLVSSLSDFTRDSRVCWFLLTAIHEEATRDMFTRIHVATGRILERPDYELVTPIDDVFASIESHLRWRRWNDAIDDLKALRRSTRPRNGPLYFGGYQPFHIILFEPA